VSARALNVCRPGENVYSATPCTHPGPCDSRMNCRCFKGKLYCERNCRCSPSCVYFDAFQSQQLTVTQGPRRWTGCNSTCKKNRSCKTKKACRCRAASRECDPELCTECDARYDFLITLVIAHLRRDLSRDAHVHDTVRCENMELQRQEFKVGCLRYL
jgi:hypothetical protein